jgi:RNA polymerase sporulation-specific sigma factor
MTVRRRRHRSGRTTSSDSQLASRAAEGDSLAFAVLLGRHGDLVRVSGARYFLPGHDRADVEQEAALGLYRACVDFRPERGVPFRAFADLCVRRAVLTALTAARRAKHGPLNERIALEAPLASDGDGRPLSELVAAPAELEPPARVEARARLRRLRELPARLSERERVVLARVLAGAALADAGAGLGANPTKLADNALTRARRKARNLLALEEAA